MKPSTKKLISGLRSTHTFNNVSGSRDRKQQARRLRLANRYLTKGMVRTAAKNPHNSYASKILKGK